MKNLVAQISGVAALALAALPVAALPAAAFAAPPAQVRISDIDLLTADGMQTFQHRADYAARDYCHADKEKGLRPAADCRKAVKRDLNEKVAMIRAAKLQQATTFAAR